VYLLYNGISATRARTAGNVLTRSVLAQLREFAGTKVVYCAGCLLGRERLASERIVVRQTPYEIKSHDRAAKITRSACWSRSATSSG
jgi:chromosome condensin MukBEF MukE localization factor